VLKPIRNDDVTPIATIQDSAIDWERMIEICTARPEWPDLATRYKNTHENAHLLHDNEIAREIVSGEYLNTSLDDPGKAMAMLQVKPGQSLTKFVIGVIQSADAARIADECRGKFDELRWRSFLHGVRGIEGWPEDPPTVEVRGIKYVSPEWLEKNFIRGLRTVALEIGLVIWRWNQLTGEEIKN
jgi:hypothetical protein